MGKHKKLLRSEKAKVKLRTKKDKDKLLPKGLNITNVTFKSKKINIQEQLKGADESQILSRRKLDVKVKQQIKTNFFNSNNILFTI